MGGGGGVAGASYKQEVDLSHLDVFLHADDLKFKFE